MQLPEKHFFFSLASGLICLWIFASADALYLNHRWTAEITDKMLLVRGESSKVQGCTATLWMLSFFSHTETSYNLQNSTNNACKSNRNERNNRPG